MPRSPPSLANLLSLPHKRVVFLVKPHSSSQLLPGSEAVVAYSVTPTINSLTNNHRVDVSILLVA